VDERESIRFELGDIVHEAVPKCDAVTIVDVLYLLAPGDQEEVLRKAAGALAENAPLVVKAQERAPSPRYALTYAQELVATSIGLTRGRRGRFHFLARAEAVAMFERAGFLVDVIEMPIENAGDWDPGRAAALLSGLGLGARMIAGRLAGPELGRAEQRFLSSIRTAFSSLEGEGEQQLYMEGAASLLSESHFGDLPDIDRLMRTLERRASVLRMLRSALDERSVFLWIGDENPQPELRSVSVVGANYGLGYRNLGSVGVVGPLRMDYATAIVSVRDTARELSRYFESVYE